MSLRSMPNPFVSRALEDLFPGRPFLYLRQDHTKIVRAMSKDDAPGEIGDGLLSRDAGTVLGVTVADCMPIFLYDPVQKVKGVLHSGWKGTGIIAEALTLLQREFGTQTRDLLVTLGPSIGPCCYNVPQERAEAFRDDFGNGAALLRDGTWYLDLAEANLGILRTAGVEKVNIVRACTFCDSRFSSYRRDGSAEYSRMLALIG